jgi:hypothetical protein
LYPSLQTRPIACNRLPAGRHCPASWHTPPPTSFFSGKIQPCWCNIYPEYYVYPGNPDSGDALWRTTR